MANAAASSLWAARRTRAKTRAVSAGSSSADPSATVLVGGLTGNNYAYLDQLYANGAKGSFDGVAVHTDTACLTNGPTAWARDAPSGRISQT